MKWIVRIFILIIVGLFILASWAYQEDISADVIEQEFSDEESKFVVVDEIKTHYKIEGNGPVLLLLHGTASSLHTWDSWTKRLTEHFTVVRLDLPAFGLTGATVQRDYSLTFYVDFIEQFTQQLNIEKFSVAGNSLGGGIAWSYATQHPQRVEKLILIDSAGFPKNEKPLVFKLAQNPISAAILKYLTPKEFMRLNLEQVYHQHELISNELIQRYWRLSLREGSRQAFVDRTKATFDYPLDSLSTLQIPTLILWGKEDKWIDVSNADKFAQQLPQSTVIIYPILGHVPMEEDPSSTVDDSIQFLLSK